MLRPPGVGVLLAAALVAAAGTTTLGRTPEGPGIAPDPELAASPPPEPVATPAGTSAPDDPELVRALALLAERAKLHRALLFRFQCREDIVRQVRRRLEYTDSGLHPEMTLHERDGVVVEQGADGGAHAVRVKVDHAGKVKLDRKGVPIEARLPRDLEPVSSAVPHAQAAIFTSEGEQQLAFRILPSGPQDGSAYRIRCAPDRLAIEFLDKEPPRADPECKAAASGQLCIDRQSGEIERIVFYGLDKVGERCVWNRQAPFAMVDQGVVEPRTGARFPSRVQTIFSLSRRDDALFDQHFLDCVFTNVEVEATIGGVVGPQAKP